MQEHGGTLNTYYDILKAKLERVAAECFQPYDILEKVKPQRHYKDQWLLGIRAEERISRESTKDLQNSETILCDT